MLFDRLRKLFGLDKKEQVIKTVVKPSPFVNPFSLYGGLVNCILGHLITDITKTVMIFGESQRGEMWNPYRYPKWFTFKLIQNKFGIRKRKFIINRTRSQRVSLKELGWIVMSL